MAASRAILGRLWRNLTGKAAQASTSTDQATRAPALNAAISRLWQAEGTHTRDAFEQQIVPAYTALLDQLKAQLPAEAAEARLLALLEETTTACHYRWSVRLPMKRPGSDYRKVEIIYTYALLTAMAVQCLRDVIPDSTASPEGLAARILPEAGRAQLQADALVWEDWLGFFQKAALGGLYAVSRCGAPNEAPQKHATPPEAQTAIPVNHTPPPGSGKAMLLAIKTALDAGTLSCNRPGDLVQVDGEGRTYLVHPAILEWCKGALSLDDKTKRLENRFARLTIFKRSPGGNLLYRGRLRNRGAHSQGYVVEDATQLWSNPPSPGRFVIENVTAKQSAHGPVNMRPNPNDVTGHL